MKSLCVIVALSVGSTLPALGAVDNTWDWVKCSRDLYFNFAGGAYDPNNVIVGMNQFGANITLKDAFTLAVTEWNHAITTNNNPQWRLHIGNAVGGAPQITVRMGAGPGPGNTDGMGVPRFGMPNGSSQGDDIDGNSGAPGNWGGGGGGNSLALFQGVVANPNYPNILGSGFITFNPLAPWQMLGAFTYDPVIASLHEIGHAMKLDHNGGPIKPPDVYKGSIMAAQMAKGVHTANSFADAMFVTHNYYPAMVDILDAQTSCAACTPTPGAAGPLLAMVGLVTIRRRRAA